MVVIRSAYDAELNAAAEMRKLGFTQVTVSPVGPDAGIDVHSREALAQVKWKDGTVGRPDLQRLYGARGENRSKTLIFFSKSAYTKHAVEYANAVAMCLFVYNGSTGAISPANKHSLALTKRVAAAAKSARESQNDSVSAGHPSGSVIAPAKIHGNLPDPDAWDRLRAGEGYRPSAVHRPGDDPMVDSFIRWVCRTVIAALLIGAFVAAFIHDGHLGGRILTVVLLLIGALVVFLFQLAGTVSRNEAVENMAKLRAAKEERRLSEARVHRGEVKEVPAVGPAKATARPPAHGSTAPNHSAARTRPRKKKKKKKKKRR
ncbi:hypothetical protein GS896_27550 [Rhodococcus hoagii]|nr:hypothetical protein [Prescottella equi]MBM4654008.1 hypothetical protein [Prescottella equi]MBM4719729.1 hypothetical protein [Prescottella equi]NKR23526.1 hypothetical protein [Prescottella equi]NKT56320.1 hypothetical protein [Prescottella equi]